MLNIIQWIVLEYLLFIKCFEILAWPKSNCVFPFFHLRANERRIFHETQKLYWTIYCSVMFLQSFRQLCDSATNDSFKNDLIYSSTVRFSKPILTLSGSLMASSSQTSDNFIQTCTTFPFPFRKWQNVWLTILKSTIVNEIVHFLLLK